MAGGPAATSDPEVTSKVETARHRAETWVEAGRAPSGSPLPSSRAPGLWASFPRANVRRARVSPQGGRAVPAPGLAHPEARGPLSRSQDARSATPVRLPRPAWRDGSDRVSAEARRSEGGKGPSARPPFLPGLRACLPPNRPPGGRVVTWAARHAAPGPRLPTGSWRPHADRDGNTFSAQITDLQLSPKPEGK